MRRLGSLALMAWLGVAACDDRNEPKPVEPTSTERQGQGVATSPAAPPWDSALHELWAVSIEPSSMGDGTYRVDPFVAALALERLRETKGAPIFAATPEGYRVGALEGDSLWAALGLQKGDVVASMNGVALDGPEALEQALVGSQNQIVVEIVRDGIASTYAYRFAPGQAWAEVLAKSGGAVPTRRATGPVGVEPTSEAPSVDPKPAAPSLSERSTEPRRSPSRSTRPRSRTAKPSAAANTPRPASPSSSAVRCSSATRCSITRARLRQIMAASDPARAQGTIVPAIRNNVHSGYKLKTVRSGSDLAGLGFRSGDKITHINGRDLTNDAQAMQIYLTLGSTRSFNIRYERGGRALSKLVAVTE